ncbi:restriction endonuclease [Paenisporosarcina sp. NPDC076898]|uniref:restriction endonuclease n=1 Tax=unclassified Paenisporosarcina TaxID=2642018 RepID=UPI003D0542C4
MFAIKKIKRNQDSLEIFVKISAISGFTVLMLTDDIGVAVLTSILTFLFAKAWETYRIYSIKSMLQKSNISDIDMMNGVEFENFLAQLFASRGYKVELTATSGDNGADLILNRGKKRIVVQVKRYSKPVGVKAIQEVNSSIKVYKANEAWVVTNNEYTRAAIALAKVNDVHLIGRNQLIKLIAQANSIHKPKIFANFWKFNFQDKIRKI